VSERPRNHKREYISNTRLQKALMNTYVYHLPTKIEANQSWNIWRNALLRDQSLQLWVSFGWGILDVSLANMSNMSKKKVRQ